MSLVKSIAGYASGFNWYKLAAKAVVALSLIAGSYFYGVHNCEIKHEHQQTIAANKHVQAITSEVKSRVPETQNQDRIATQRREEVKSTGDKLHDSLAKTPNAGNCTFSDEQLRLFRKLAEATHSVK